MMDADSNGRVSPAEWEALFKKASKGKGYLTAEDLREAFPLMPPRQAGPPPKKDEGPTLGFTLTLLKGLADGELGSIYEGPAVGAKAPDFTLPTVNGKERINLAKFRAGKPTVLVFGSFT